MRDLDLSMSGISAEGRREFTRVVGATRFVRTAEAAEALHVDADTAAKKLSRWASQGWLRRVHRGLYLAVPVDAQNPERWSEDPLVVATQVWPGYFSGWTAAGHWSLTDQTFTTTIVKTTVKIRGSSVRLLDAEYLLAPTTETEMSWGLRSEWRDDSRLKFADPARTVVDILDEPRLAGGIRHGAEILQTFLDDHGPAHLSDYTDRLGNRSVFKRLGFLLETLNLPFPDLVRTCRDRMPQGITALDPSGPSGGRVVTRWNLRMNVSVDQEDPS